jgi:hypothetical protein
MVMCAGVGRARGRKKQEVRGRVIPIIPATGKLRLKDQKF